MRMKDLLTEAEILKDIRTNKQRYRACWLVSSKDYTPSKYIMLTNEDDKFYNIDLVDSHHLYALDYNSFLVDHASKTIDLDIFYTNSKTRRATGHIIPGADTSFEKNSSLFKKLLKEVIKFDPDVINFTVSSKTALNGKSVKDVLGFKSPVNTISQSNFGKIELYHGTSLRRWGIIEKQGLRPGNAPKVYVDLVANYSEKNVYLTTSLAIARNYATRAAVDDKSTAAVLIVEVNDFTKFVPDEDNLHWTSGMIKHKPKILDWIFKKYGDRAEIHFKHLNWEDDTDAEFKADLMKIYFATIYKGMAKSSSIGYRGRILPSKIKLKETYKPAKAKGKYPSDEDFEAAVNKTEKTIKTFA